MYKGGFILSDCVDKNVTIVSFSTNNIIAHTCNKSKRYVVTVCNKTKGVALHNTLVTAIFSQQPTVAVSYLTIGHTVNNCFTVPLCKIAHSFLHVLIVLVKSFLIHQLPFSFKGK